MSSTLFYVFYDTLWFCIVYSLFYWGVDLFFRDYAQALKIIANVDVDHIGYNREHGPKERHECLFWSSAPWSFIVLTMNPIVYSIIYLLFMFMVSTMELNRILLYVLLFKVAYKFNPFDYSCDFKPHCNMSDFFLAVQIFFVMIGYSDGGVLLPTLFQLIDESTGFLSTTLDKMLSSHAKLFKCDTWISGKLFGIKVATERRKRWVYWTKFWLMVFIFAIHVIYVANLSRLMDVTFCYYSAARVVQIYLEDLREKTA